MPKAPYVTTNAKERKNLSDLRHPQYVLNQENWEKWRLCYLGGNRFIKRYLKKASRREDDNDFTERLAVTYCPAFAKAAINDVKNSIFQRICDVTRSGGPKSYKDAMDGSDTRGVDLLGSSMNTFIGRDVLPELLTMARVGIYVDMPALPGPTLADKGDLRPYLYWYKAEDIRSWANDDSNNLNSDPTEFKALLLRDSTYDIDAHWVLPYETTTRYRYLWIDPSDGYVRCQFYSETGDPYSPQPGYDITWDGEEEKTATPDDEGIIVLPIKKIPFVMLELTDSLLADAADYQIALLNMASHDVAFSIKANYPFYTEQRDTRTTSPHLKQAGTAFGLPGVKETIETNWNPQTNFVMVNQDNAQEVRVGVSQGRAYPVGVERPGFIAPPTEPLKVSMEKQEQLKREIRQLINLAITSLSPKMASAESKAQDNQGLEAGLSYIGLELEHAERKIAYYWAMYEGSEAATVKYPENYSILDEKDRREQADALTEMLPHIPSLTAQREVAKKLVRIVLGTSVRNDLLKKIDSEIDQAPVIIGDPKVIEMDVQNGLVSHATASKARGYPEGEVEKAKKEYTERLALIATSQAEGGGTGAAAGGQARGVSDLGADPKAGKKEKAAAADTTLDPIPKDKTRGEGK